jgi:hypothetical protein
VPRNSYGIDDTSTAAPAADHSARMEVVRRHASPGARTRDGVMCLRTTRPEAGYAGVLHRRPVSRVAVGSGEDGLLVHRNAAIDVQCCPVMFLAASETGNTTAAASAWEPQLAHTSATKDPESRAAPTESRPKEPSIVGCDPAWWTLRGRRMRLPQSWSSRCPPFRVKSTLRRVSPCRERRSIPPKPQCVRSAAGELPSLDRASPARTSSENAFWTPYPRMDPVFLPRGACALMAGRVVPGSLTPRRLDPFTSGRPARKKVRHLRR